jgi:hypothetical protein
MREAGFFGETLKERDHLEDSGLGKRTELK